jgi:hypothetical protein
MIHISCSVRRSFLFPADLPTTCAYFGDFNRAIGRLPHIRLVNAYAPNHFRMLYHASELGLYRIRLYCDVQAQFDAKRRILRVTPLNGHLPVKARVTINSLTAQGTYTSESVFHPAGGHTRVDYHLSLRATVPKLLGLRLVPDGVLDRIAHTTAMWRIHEVADGFIEQSIREFEQGKRRGRKSSTG